jgi:hypothetical protein
MMCCLFDCDEVGLRLSILTHAMCPNFHTDKVSGRLICTYIGAGTQYISKHDKDALQAKTGDVILLKGEAWPGNEGNGAIHRSPQLPDGQRRLLLTLDPL